MRTWWSHIGLRSLASYCLMSSHQTEVLEGMEVLAAVGRAGARAQCPCPRCIVRSSVEARAGWSL